MNLSKAHLDLLSSYNSCLFAVTTFIDQRWVVEAFRRCFCRCDINSMEGFLGWVVVFFFAKLSVSSEAISFLILRERRKDRSD